MEERKGCKQCKPCFILDLSNICDPNKYYKGKKYKGQEVSTGDWKGKWILVCTRKYFMKIEM